MADLTMEEAQRELEEAIDEVTDWLEYDEYTNKSIEPSLKRLNAARLRMLVLRQRARTAGVMVAGHQTLPAPVVAAQVEQQTTTKEKENDR